MSDDYPAMSARDIEERDFGWLASGPHATGPIPENPYCMKCSKHLGIPFHESSEHGDASTR